MENEGYTLTSVRDNIGDFDIAAFEHFLQAVQFSGTFLYKADTITGKLPKFSLLTAGKVACPDKAVLQKVGNPFRIPDVCLAPRNILDISGISHNGIKP